MAGAKIDPLASDKRSYTRSVFEGRYRALTEASIKGRIDPLGGKGNSPGSTVFFLIIGRAGIELIGSSSAMP